MKKIIIVLLFLVSFSSADYMGTVDSDNIVNTGTAGGGCYHIGSAISHNYNYSGNCGSWPTVCYNASGGQLTKGFYNGYGNSFTQFSYSAVSCSCADGQIRDSNGTCITPTPTCNPDTEILQNNECVCKYGQDTNGTCQPLQCNKPVINNPRPDVWIEFNYNTAEECQNFLIATKRSGTFITSGDIGCQSHKCFGDDTSVCNNLSLAQDLQKPNYIYKGLVTSDSVCASYVNQDIYIDYYTASANANCPLVTKLYCYLLPRQTIDSNSSNASVNTPYPTFEDLNSTVPISYQDNNSSSSSNTNLVSSKLSQIYNQSINNYSTLNNINNNINNINNNINNLSNVQNETNNILNKINDKLDDNKVYDYLSQNVDSEIQSQIDNANDIDMTNVNDKVTSAFGTYTNNYFNAPTACGSFNMSNISFALMGKNMTWDMSQLNSLMNSSDMDSLFSLIKLFLYFTVALSAFKIFARVG